MKPNKLLFPRTIDELFHRVWDEPRAKTAKNWTPRVDVMETAEAYVIEAEIPGIAVEDVEVTVTPDELTITGEKKTQTERAEGETGRHITERVFGAFTRKFTFPLPVSTDDVEAEANQGILTVTIKKAEKERTRKIDIRSN